MRFLKLLIYGFFALLILVFAIPLFLPSSIALSHSIKIHAEAREVFRLVNDFENWKRWSPFQLDNPDVQARISGAASGEGSQLIYKSNTAGDGTITIIQSQPYSSIRMMLGMQKGGIAVDEWTFEQNSDTVLVTWTLKLSELKYPFHRYFGFFSRSLMTPFQQKGLEKLREVAVQMPGLLPVDTIVQEAFRAVVVKPDPGSQGLSTDLSAASAEVRGYLNRLRVKPEDGLVGIFNGMQPMPPAEPLIGYPVSEETRESGKFSYIEVSAGKAIATTLVGSLDGRKRAYDELNLSLREFRLQRDSTKPMLELYSPAHAEPINDQPMVTRFVVFLKEKNGN